jgi:hypothetical protein
VKRLTSKGWNLARGAQIRGDRRVGEEGKRRGTTNTGQNVGENIGQHERINERINIGA